MVPYADYDAGTKEQYSQELLFRILSDLEFILGNRTAPYLGNCRAALLALVKIGWFAAGYRNSAPKTHQNPSPMRHACKVLEQHFWECLP